MAIEISGRTYRTLSDELFINNGSKVLEAYVNGLKVYPEVGKYVMRKRYGIKINPGHDYVIRMNKASIAELSLALDNHFGNPGEFALLSMDCMKELNDGAYILANVETCIDVVYSADEIASHGSVPENVFVIDGRTAKNLTITSFVHTRTQLNGWNLYGVLEGGNGNIVFFNPRYIDACLITKNRKDGQIGLIYYPTSAVHSKALNDIISFRGEYKTLYKGGLALDSFAGFTSGAYGSSNSFVRFTLQPGTLSNFSYEVNIDLRDYTDAFPVKGLDIRPKVSRHIGTRPYWVSTGDNFTRSYSSDNPLSDSVRLNTYDVYTLVGSPAPDWACDPRIPEPDDYWQHVT